MRRTRRRRRRTWRQTSRAFLGPKPVRRERLVLLGLVVLGLAVLALRWLERPPRRPGDLCAIFSQKPSWHASARSSFEDWGVPEAVQLAMIHQESGFRARVRPPRRKFLWIFPGPRRSTAYGYAQVLDSTWLQFRDASGRPRAERHRFDDAAHFIGWYGAEIHRLTGVAKDDAYRLYLAYHEGPGGYARGSHRGKPWLLEVARKVEARAGTYRRQYAGCRERLGRRRLWCSLGIVLLLGLAAWGYRRMRRRLG